MLEPDLPSAYLSARYDSSQLSGIEQTHAGILMRLDGAIKIVKAAILSRDIAHDQNKAGDKRAKGCVDLQPRSDWANGTSSTALGAVLVRRPISWVILMANNSGLIGVLPVG
jgi:hypothetical protein